MQEHFIKAKHLIDNSQSILLTMHERMDGDDGGSVLAMAHLLETIGKKVTSTIKFGVPPSLEFLPGSHKILEDITHKEFDLLITFGCGEKDRCGIENILQLKVPTLNIDHHPDNKLFGDVNIVDAQKSSVAELVYDFFVFNSWKITKDIATCLLTGIITDTGSFMHNNTTASALKTAAELMKKGARSSKIVKHTYKNKTPNTFFAWSKAIENSFYDPKNKIIFSIITEGDLKEIGELPKAAFDGLAETLNTVPEAKMAMFLRQDGEVIKGSLRSEEHKGINVAKIARLLGGGGHTLAAGFSLAGTLTKDETGTWKVI